MWYIFFFLKKETTFVTSCSLSYNSNFSQKEVCSKRKEFLQEPVLSFYSRPLMTRVSDYFFTEYPSLQVYPYPTELDEILSQRFSKEKQ